MKRSMPFLSILFAMVLTLSSLGVAPAVAQGPTPPGAGSEYMLKYDNFADARYQGNPFFPEWDSEYVAGSEAELRVCDAGYTCPGPYIMDFKGKGFWAYAAGDSANRAYVQDNSPISEQRLTIEFSMHAVSDGVANVFAAYGADGRVFFRLQVYPGSAGNMKARMGCLQGDNTNKYTYWYLIPDTSLDKWTTHVILMWDTGDATHVPSCTFRMINLETGFYAADQTIYPAGADFFRVSTVRLGVMSSGTTAINFHADQFAEYNDPWYGPLSPSK